MSAKYRVPRGQQSSSNVKSGDNGVAASGSNDEKRRDSRSSFDIKIGVSTHHRLFVGLMANISTGGLFVATEEDLERGDRVEVRFQIPGSDHVFHKEAEVCWTRPYDDNNLDNSARAGAGVRLVGLDDEERRMLNAFIDVHEPLFFES